MCFGSKETEKKEQTFTADPRINSAVDTNLSYAANLAGPQSYQPYTGEMVAGPSDLQTGAYGLTSAVAGDPRYADAARDLIGRYANAGPSTVTADKIAGGVPTYMSQYVEQALAPQLRLQQQGFDAQNRDFNRSATMAGAFGDDRAGIGRDQLAEGQTAQRSGLIGSAYQDAYNRALAASAQDVSNSVNAQNANAGWQEQYLGRALGGSGAYQGLQNQQLGVANAVNTIGQSKTGFDQANLNAAYQEYLRKYGNDYAALDALNKTLSTAGGVLKPSSDVTTFKPDDSGWGAAGAVASAAVPFLLSDVRVKEDITPVGKMHDGTNIYSFRYKGPDPRLRLGVMAQEIEQTMPEAVHDVGGGLKAVDYEMATRPSRGIARALGIAA